MSAAVRDKLATPERAKKITKISQRREEELNLCSIQISQFSVGNCIMLFISSVLCSRITTAIGDMALGEDEA